MLSTYGTSQSTDGCRKSCRPCSYIPDVMDLGTTYTDRFAGHPRPKRCMIPKTGRVTEGKMRAGWEEIQEKRTRSPGPGYYGCDSSFPDKKDQTCAGVLTSSQTSFRWSFLAEPRASPDGVLKGMSSTAGNKQRLSSRHLGPGLYRDSAAQAAKRGASAPSFSIGNSTETAEHNRLRKCGLSKVPPGTYPMRSDFDMSSDVAEAMAAMGQDLTLTLKREATERSSHSSPGAPRRRKPCERCDPHWGNMLSIPKRTQVLPDFQRTK